MKHRLRTDRLLPAMLAALSAAGCLPEIDLPQVDVRVSGAVESVESVRVTFEPASRGDYATEYAAVADAVEEDQRWLIEFEEMAVGRYKVTAQGLDTSQTPVQVARSEWYVEIYEGKNRLDVQLPPVDCAALDCAQLETRCARAMCDSVAGRCVTRVRVHVSGCVQDGGAPAVADDATADAGLAADATSDAGLAADATSDAGLAADATSDAGLAADVTSDARRPTDVGVDGFTAGPDADTDVALVPDVEPTTGGG